jgi:hypothetical protein
MVKKIIQIKLFQVTQMKHPQAIKLWNNWTTSSQHNCWVQFHTDFYSSVNHKNWFDFLWLLAAKSWGVRIEKQQIEGAGGHVTGKSLIWIILLTINSLLLPKTVLSSTMNSSLPQSITYVWASRKPLHTTKQYIGHFDYLFHT